MENVDRIMAGKLKSQLQISTIVYHSQANNYDEPTIIMVYALAYSPILITKLPYSSHSNFIKKLLPDTFISTDIIEVDKIVGIARYHYGKIMGLIK